VRYLYLILSLLVCACSSSGALPSRQEWELYRQANSPDSRHCQIGTRPYYVYGDDGTPFFVECMR